MLFVNPGFLFGLFAIAIPIVIHLFNFRRFRKVYFTNVRFIRQLQQETQKQSRLRHLVILALRCLAIIALVLAFAQPYIPYSEKQKTIAARNDVSVFVDNSFSMEAVGSNGSLLDAAKQKAREIVAAYKASDNYQLLTNDFEGRHQRYVTRDEFLILLDEIKPSPSSRKIDEVISRQKELFESKNGNKKSAFIISDFQKSNYAILPSVADTTLDIFMVPLIANIQSNVFIDSCWFDLPLQQPGQTAVLNAKIVNKSGKDLEKIPVRLEIDGKQRAVASIDLKDNASESLKIPFTNHDQGNHHGLVQLSDYPVTFDDHFYFSYSVSAKIDVLAINGTSENSFISALFSQDSAIRLTQSSERSLDYTKLANYSLIILNELPSLSSGLAQELNKYLQNGGALAILPSASMEISSFNTFLSRSECPSFLPADTSDSKVNFLNQDHPLYRDVFEQKPLSNSPGENLELPKVLKYFPLQGTSFMKTQSLLRLINGREFLSVTQSATGQVFLFAAPMKDDFTDFHKQALFVPTLYNMALLSKQPGSLFYIIGENKAIRVNHEFPDGEKVFKIRSADGKFEIIPEQQRAGAIANVFANNQVRRAGHYYLLNQGDTIAGLSFNYNRSESNPECLAPGDLEDAIGKQASSSFKLLNSGYKPLNEVLEELNFGKRFWKYCVFAALIFLLLEILLVRFWKT